MNKEEIGLNNRLAELGGFKWDSLLFLWATPEEVGCGKPPDFTKSLNHCYKYLVPKLGDCKISILVDDGYYFATIIGVIIAGISLWLLT